ncbi:TIGR02677 family protein [Rosistilla carotiformis]|uniref:TIGR02677 family protein n=1 Tax=Rosistilla carotiformis TaxID=2528017 RepID=A0A518JR74_9BACT|nr:TIGR02677 family protein [Rosistilla carotiformis]QDV68035.1 hypothetical protein Poly24_17410 [Rosistilla carotiformis]
MDDGAVDWLCFSYLTAERAVVYRAIVDVFAAAKAEFALHLRASEVQSELVVRGTSLDLSDVESALQQLESWGNLQSYQDNADVASLTDYYRKRLLYQLSASGEAAHASTLTFTERLQQQAKLDARALDRIADGAGQLERLAIHLRDADEKDPVVTLTTLRSISQDADELTSRAQSFFRWLHEQTESDRGDLEAFLVYKQQLIDYLQQFVSELILRTDEIAGRLRRIQDWEFERLAEIAATEEVGEPRAGEEQQHERRISDMAIRWRQRLAGLQGWFMQREGRPPQSDQLRAAARAAIPRLLQLASQMNERQSGRSDRVADLRALAINFLQARDEAQSHRLFRAAFALSPSRHLRIDPKTIDSLDQNRVRPDTRWIDAEPIEMTPQLREKGRAPSAAANRRVTDRSAERAELQRRLGRETGRDEASRETLVALGRCRLSEIGGLDQEAFKMLLGLLELAVPKGDVSRVTATSRDGRLRIGLEMDSGQELDRADSKINIARIDTEDGTLVLQDAWMEVTRV